ncbi:hypothetical protein LguiB_008082 [Lonicera macranthoides]
MAALSAACVRFTTPVHQPIHTNQKAGTTPNLKLFFLGSSNGGFRCLRTSRSQVSCSAKPETVDKVCEIVRKQLVLSPESELTPDSKFSALGADSLDTVEIVMGLEEEFDISVEEDSSQSITTVQEAAELIEKLVEKKSQA